MSVPAIAPALYDSKYGTWVALDVELLRLLALGAKALVDLSINTTVQANTNTSNTVDVWKSDNQLVIKYIDVRGVPSGNSVAKVTLIVDGNSMDITQLGDLEANYGIKIYGTVIQVQVTLASNVTSNTTLTVVVRGYNAGKVQVPS